MAKNTSGYPNREFLQLAETYSTDSIGGWMFSEKLDGVRCFWDGGATRGMRVEDVPFANVEKQYIKVDQHYSTGLWSRYGHPYQAPHWFLDNLPKIPLDGELYIGRKKWEETSSIVRSHNAGERWRKINYKVFETLSIEEVFQDGMINNPNMVKLIKGDTRDWMISMCKHADVKMISKRIFQTQLELLKLFVPENECIQHHKQELLPRKESLAKIRLNEVLAEVITGDGEGLIVRDPSAIWIPRRCKHILKLKDALDSEAVVIGYVSGMGKLLGMMGSLILDWNGKVFNLSGFDDHERVLPDDVSRWCTEHPDTQLPDHMQSLVFPRKTIVTFKYASTSAMGMPKEARYLRKWKRA